MEGADFSEGSTITEGTTGSAAGTVLDTGDINRLTSSTDGSKLALMRRLDDSPRGDLVGVTVGCENRRIWEGMEAGASTLRGTPRNLVPIDTAACVKCCKLRCRYCVCVS